METAEWRGPPRTILNQRIGIDGPILDRENKVEVVKRLTPFSWWPKKGLVEDIVDKETNILDDSEDLESGAEDCCLDDDDDDSILIDSGLPEITTSFRYEKEDWDKELEEYEYNSKPYDFDDIIHCESFQDQDQMVSCSHQGEPLYDPSSHHVAPLTWGQLETVAEDGQFDDAAD